MVLLITTITHSIELLKWSLLSKQILLPKIYHGRPPPTSPKYHIWPSQGRPDLTSLRLPQSDVQGTSLGGWFGKSPRRPLKHSNLDVPKFLFNFSFRTYSINQIYLKASQHSRCIENPVKLLKWSIFCKIN